MASITDQNWIVWNQGKNPLVNFNFMLRVELMFDLPCKSVRAFTRELEYDYIQEGGLNDYVHMRRKPITRPFTLEIERYVGVDYIDPLPLGADLVLPVLLFVSRNHDQFIPGVVARTYVFTGCTVMKKTYGDLVADQSGLLVETTTLGDREMLCVDIPWSEVGDNISKDIKTVPTNAKSADKTPAELKALANDLYSQALAAKTQADVEFAEEDATALISELEETLTKLRAAVGSGGSLTQQLDTAKRGINGEGGKTKKALADEAMDDARLLEQEAKEAENAWREKDAVWRKANDTLKELQKKMKELAQKAKDLQAQLAKDGETKKELEARLPVKLRDEKAAKANLESAQKAYDEAESKLEKANAELQKAMPAIQEKPDVKAAREKAESTADELAAKQAEFDVASQSLAEAQKDYQTALQAWQEEQGKELEQAAAKRRSCEDAVRAKEEAVIQAEENTPAAQQANTELEAAQKELEEAEEAEKAARELIEKGPADGELAEQQAAVETAEQALEDAQKEVDTARAADDEAQAKLQEKTEQAVSDSEAGKAVAEASERRNEAKKALDTAEVYAKNSQDLAALNEEIEELKKEHQAAEAEAEAIGKEKMKEAENQESSTKAEADKTKKTYDTASGKWKEAVEKATNARNAAELADQALSKAQAAHNMGAKQINLLQNSLTNMKLRKDTGKEAQKNCGDQHDKCKEENESLQALPDDDLLQINIGYAKVKKLSKQTCYHEKQVREVCQHMQAARKLLSEVVEIPDTTDTSGSSDTSEAAGTGE